MAKAPRTITLSPSRDIPFSRLVLSQANVRKIKAGISVSELAEDIARRTLLQSLNVRPLVNEQGEETGQFEVPAGGRRYRALELLVKQKRLASDAPIPCVVKSATNDVTAEEDSFAENTFREQLHPLDQFRAMQAMVDKGADVDAIAAHFMTTPAVVRQRLKLAGVSAQLHDVYAEDGMTLEQLMAFTVSEDHQRQEQVWELLAHSYNKSAHFIRSKLTENTVRVADKRAAFVTLDAYVAAGGGVMRDLFEDDDGGWLTDPALLDRLVSEKLKAAGESLVAEGWKWVDAAIDLPWNVTGGLRELTGAPVPMTAEEEARLAELQEEARGLEDEWSDAGEIPDEVASRLEVLDENIGALLDRPVVYAQEEMARAGAFVSVHRDGSLRIERGYIRSEDEERLETPGSDTDDRDRNDSGDLGNPARNPDGEASSAPTGLSGQDEESDEEMVKPLSDRLVAELTAWRTLALQDAMAQSPSLAFTTVLHAFVLGTFYSHSPESCIQISLNKASFAFAPEGLKDSPPARSLAERHARWKSRLPQSDKTLWDELLKLDATEQAALFAHCASLTLNAQAEVVPKYDNGRVSKHSIERRIAHSDVLARAVGLDLVEAGWRPTVESYFHYVTKPRILADVSEAKGAHFADMIDHLKKADMAREAERLMADAGWLPEPIRTSAPADLLGTASMAGPDASQGLPAFLDEEQAPAANDDGIDAAAAA